SARMATARVGSCGVSSWTTPSDVTTKLGLQPRSFVVVKTFGVTRSSSRVATAIGPGSLLLRGGEPAVDAQDLASHERRRIGAQEDRRTHEILRLADPTERDSAHEVGLEVRVSQQRRDLRRIDEGRHDGVDADPV